MIFDFCHLHHHNKVVIYVVIKFVTEIEGLKLDDCAMDFCNYIDVEVKSGIAYNG